MRAPFGLFRLLRGTIFTMAARARAPKGKAVRAMAVLDSPDHLRWRVFGRNGQAIYRA